MFWYHMQCFCCLLFKLNKKIKAFICPAVTIKKAVYDYLGQIRFFVQSYREKYDESSSLKHNTLRASKMKLFAFWKNVYDVYI